MTIKRVVDAGEIAADMEALARDWEQLAAEAMYRVIENPIMSESIVECPFETGLLASTGTVDDPVITPGSISVKFGYGTDYGFWVHEIPPGGDFWGTMASRDLRRQQMKAAPTTEKGTGFDLLGGVRKLRTATRTVRNVSLARTAYHKPPTKWKFLEDPVNRHIDKVPEAVLDEMDRMMLEKREPVRGEQ